MGEVLCSGYCMPLHHLSPVTWKPMDFSSYSSGSEKAQAFQEVDKMLVKGALEEVEDPRSGY